MEWNVYEIAPIDIGWHHIDTVKETSLKLAKIPDNVGEYDLNSFLRLWQSAQFAAGSKGWDGEFRGDPCVFWMPFDDAMRCGFVFKQDNNGTTYVVSEVAFPRLA